MNNIISWFVKNSIAANLLMGGIIIAGLVISGTLRQEVIPTIKIQSGVISVAYPGAAPSEVEQGICLPIEKVVQGLSGVDEVTSEARENIGIVTVKFLDSVDRNSMLNDVKAAVDSIDNFPIESETPQVKLIDMIVKVMDVVVSGDTSEKELRKAVNIVEQHLLAHPGITLVTLSNAPTQEIAIEVSQENLNRYKLSFQEITAAIQNSSINVPGGSLNENSGELLLRVNQQAYTTEDFSKIPIRNQTNGRSLTLGEIATIKDGFKETNQRNKFNQKPSLALSVFRVGNQEALVLADYVNESLNKAKEILPAGIELSIRSDDTQILKSRLNLMLENGRAGLILVLIALALFLKLRIAAWTAIGIPVAFLGAILLMPSLDVSINLISLFGFILVLGIVVDDAIVVAENIYQKRSEGMPALDAAIRGAQEMAKPVTFAILTTIIAFAPMLMVPGSMGQFSRNIPLIAIAVLIFSLVEALLILPAHLKNLPNEKNTTHNHLWSKIQSSADYLIQFTIKKIYQPVLNWAAPNRYLVVSASLAMLLFTLGYVASGRINFNFFPQIEADDLVVNIEMPLGVPVDDTEKAIQKIEFAALELQNELFNKNGKPIIKTISTSIGTQPFLKKQQQMGGGMGDSQTGGHLAEIHLELLGAENRKITGAEIIQILSKKVGVIAGTEKVNYSADLITTQGDVDLRISGENFEDLIAVSQRIQKDLINIYGVMAVYDTFVEGKREIKIELLPKGEALGLSTALIGRQIRQAYFGSLVQSFQRQGSEVEVYLRLPVETREDLNSLNTYPITTPLGNQIPLSSVAKLEYSQGAAVITRHSRQRALRVQAQINKREISTDSVWKKLKNTSLESIKNDYPQVQINIAGQQEEQQEYISQLIRTSILALLGIFILLAVPLSSYLQPIIIMSAIPFGVIGAIGGHVILGYDLSLFSLIGVVALSGIVVNDSLVMIDLINRQRLKGLNTREAVLKSGVGRFRAITLTTLTTFLGLTPLLLEKSIQAKFLIPMAISVAFGIIFATFITLIIVPSLYLIIEDIRNIKSAFSQKNRF
jgi:multidrug efflux pump subunit AcrB